MLIAASFLGATIGIVTIIVCTPIHSELAFKFGPAEYFSMMAVGLLAGATLAKGSALKGVAMVVLGLLLGVVGMDVTSGTVRFAFGILELSDGLQLVALALGLFGVAEFLANVNRIGGATGAKPLNTFRPSLFAVRDPEFRHGFPQVPSAHRIRSG